MVPRWRAFVCWALALSAVWVFANWPRDGGSLKRFWRWAGFPWTFAFWDSGQLKWFDPMAFTADVALGVAAVVFVAGLCAWSRRVLLLRLGEPPLSPPGSDIK